MADDDGKTPLERLDEAVQEFVNAVATDDEAALLTGWVLGYQVGGSDDTGMWWDTRYASGPSTNPATGVGIARLVEQKISRDLGAFEPDDDDDGDGDGS